MVTVDGTVALWEAAAAGMESMAEDAVVGTAAEGIRNLRRFGRP